jgi:hypothetical protein
MAKYSSGDITTKGNERRTVDVIFGSKRDYWHANQRLLESGAPGRALKLLRRIFTADHDILKPGSYLKRPQDA